MDIFYPSYPNILKWDILFPMPGKDVASSSAYSLHMCMDKQVKDWGGQDEIRLSSRQWNNLAEMGG